MIQEISNFVDTIPQEYHTEGLKPTPGLHILIDLDKNGKLKENGYKSFLVKKKNEEIDYDFDFGTRSHYSRLVDLNKPIDNKKKIHSYVPYVLLFKNLSTDDKNEIKKKDWDAFEENERFDKITKPYLVDVIKDRIKPFYDYFINHKEITDDEKELTKRIKEFANKKILNLILFDSKTKQMDYNNYFVVYFNVAFELVKKWNAVYKKDKVFNKIDFNTDDNEFGLSNFLNGANIKKNFMLHKTTNYEVNNRIHFTTGINLAQFENLLKNRKLPNIIPIFIDKEELNKEFVRIFSRDKTLSFREIIRQLFDQHKEDISNYYLINWANRQGIVINDIDYVPKFKFFLNDFTIINIMQLPNTQERDAIKNIFDFEMTIVQKIFNNALIVKTKTNTVLFKYFDDIDAKYTTPINYQNILKYRKCFYDFIYKSKEDAINGKAFYNLLLYTIIDNIKHDEYKDNRHTKDFSIKEKLNILFSLNKNFDKLNKNFGGIDMPTKIPEFQENMRRLLNDNEYHIQTDQEFAFAAGQLIYSILKKSKSSNKSHALLEPFINKNDPTLFHDAILKGINQYKHAFEWYGEAGKGRFEKLTSEILGYECETSIKELLPIILAGYFSQSLIFEKSNKKEGE